MLLVEAGIYPGRSSIDKSSLAGSVSTGVGVGISVGVGASVGVTGVGVTEGTLADDEAAVSSGLSLKMSFAKTARRVKPTIQTVTIVIKIRGSVWLFDLMLCFM